MGKGGGWDSDKGGFIGGALYSCLLKRGGSRGKQWAARCGRDAPVKIIQEAEQEHHRQYVREHLALGAARRGLAARELLQLGAVWQGQHDAGGGEALAAAARGAAAGIRVGADGAGGRPCCIGAL